MALTTPGYSSDKTKDEDCEMERKSLQGQKATKKYNITHNDLCVFCDLLSVTCKKAAYNSAGAMETS